MLKDQHARNERVDPLRLQPQDQVAGLFLSAAKECAQSVQLLGGHAAAII